MVNWMLIIPGMIIIKFKNVLAGIQLEEVGKNMATSME